MIIEVDKSFEKDFSKIRDKNLQNRVIAKLDLLEWVKTIYEVSNVVAIKGSQNFYRIRIGDYRIGFKLDWNIVTLLRIRSRKDIYDIFP